MTDTPPPEPGQPAPGQSYETRYLDRRRIRALAEHHAEMRRRTAAQDRPGLAEAQEREIERLTAGMTGQEKTAFRQAYNEEKAGLDESLPGQFALDPWAVPQAQIRAQARDYEDLDPLEAEAMSVLANAKRDDTAVRWALWIGIGLFFVIVLILLR